jgi:GNAT superfamily N-acetyltransferase
MTAPPLPGYEVRTGRSSDANQLFELVQAFAASLEPERAQFERSFERLLTAPDGRLLVADSDGKLIGYVLGFYHETFFANGRVGWVEEIMVESGWRRRGVGRRLMDEFERWAMRRGCRLVALATRRAASFYCLLGYDESAIYFRKLISTSNQLPQLGN